MAKTTRINLDSRNLPVLYRGDAVVVGASFGGGAAALALARAGRRVVLVEARTYPGREITSTLRPWLCADASEPLSELMRICVEASGSPAVDGEIPLHMDALKLALEDQLLAAGVTLLYASTPVALCNHDGAIDGVIVGNKSGRQIVAGQMLIDATENALLLRLAGASFQERATEPLFFRRTLEFDGVGQIEGCTIPLPAELGIVDNCLIVHPGYRGEDHRLFEFQLALSAADNDPFAVTARETVARQRSMEIVAHLMHNVPAFAKAYLAAASHELYGSYATPLADSVPTWAESLAGERVEDLPLTAFAGPVAGLWTLNEAVRPAGGRSIDWCDPLALTQIGAALGSALARQWHEKAPRRFAPFPPMDRNGDGAPLELAVREMDRPQRGRAYKEQPVVPLSVPIVQTTDVLVVGGGTSGATAAITAGRAGAHTILVEMTPFLGGTGTYGGVHSYWFGRWTGFSAEVIAAVEKVHERLRHRPPQGAVPKWNIEAKAFSLLERTVEAGVDLLTNASIIGVIVEENMVRGVVVATRSGPVAILAEVTIDATGDGDVAAVAGADCVYGSERDHVVMWYSLAQFAKPGLTRGNFTSMVDVSNVEDYTRAILAGRRRGGRAGIHDHGVYIATRESRHIKADVVMTLNDQLLKRCWPDVVNIAFSNNDIKGHSTSDWLRMGLISPNLEIEIPYRALLPKELENILVVGKAISATHDALPAIRMQPDLENLGGVAAMAAAQAVADGCTPRQIDLRTLQEKLVAKGVLPPSILNRELTPLTFTDDELRRLIDRLDGERPLYLYSDMEINEVFEERIPLVDVLCAGPRAIPLLEEALVESTGKRRILLAQALAALGSSIAVPALVEALQTELAGDRLPTRSASIRHVQDPPDQGAMPEAAYLLYSLGMVPDARALPIWQRVVDLLGKVTDDDVRDRNSGIFHYADALCAGVERWGEARAIPLLMELHSYAPFRHHLCTAGFQPDYFQERQAYLEVVIGRTLARVGSAHGLLLLIDYLDDVRALLAEHAHSELVAISGQDFGKSSAAWSQWLESVGDDLQPTPWRQPSDPVQAWGETVLVEKNGDVGQDDEVKG